MTQRNRPIVSFALAVALVMLTVLVTRVASAQPKSFKERQKSYVKAMQVRKDTEDSVRALVSQPGDAGIDAARRIAFAKHPDPVAIMAIFNGLGDRPDSEQDLRLIIDLTWDMAHHFFNRDAVTSYGAFDMASGSFAGVFHHLRGNQGYVLAAAKVNDPATSDLDKALYLRVFAQRELRHKDHPYRKLAIETYRPFLSRNVSMMLQAMAIKVSKYIWDYESIPALETLAMPTQGAGHVEAYSTAMWMLAAGPDHIDPPDDIVRYARMHTRGGYKIYDEAHYNSLRNRHDQWRWQRSQKQQAERDRKAIEAAKQRAASSPATGEVFARPEPIEATTAP